MQRQTLAAVGAALLALLAIALAAATIEDRRADPGDPGFGADREVDSPTQTDYAFQFPYLEELMMVLVAVLVVVFLIYFIVNFREMVPLLIGVLVVIGLFYLLLTVIPVDPTFEEMDTVGEDNITDPREGEDGTVLDPDGEIRWMPALAVLGILGIVLFVAILVSAGASIGGSRPTDEETDTATEDSLLPADIADAAGRAADRIEAADAYENEVYRAWADLTELLDVEDPSSATPRQFAREAVSAGMAPSDVGELTQLFEDVRYGDRPPTPTREQEALDVFRRIETRYAEEE